MSREGLLVELEVLPRLAQSVGDTELKDQAPRLLLLCHATNGGGLHKFPQVKPKHANAKTCATVGDVRMFPHMFKNPRLVGSAQAAKIFGVHRATFTRWVQAGEVPIFTQVEGRTGAQLFDLDVIEELAREREKASA